MEQKTCKKCGKKLPVGYKRKKCEFCIGESAHKAKKGAAIGGAALTVLGVVGRGVLKAISKGRS